MRKVGLLVQKLEEVGVEINKLEWTDNGLDIDATPYDKAVPIFIELGYMKDTVKCEECGSYKTREDYKNYVVYDCPNGCDLKRLIKEGKRKNECRKNNLYT